MFQCVIDFCRMDGSFDPSWILYATSISILLQLDPAYPESRLNIYAQDSGAAFVLVQEQHVELAKNFGCKIILAEECLNEAMKSVNPEISGLNADSTCVLLFTSGSTGRPKGVHHVHRHLRENIMGTVELFGLGTVHWIGHYLFSIIACIFWVLIKFYFRL